MIEQSEPELDAAQSTRTHVLVFDEDESTCVAAADALSTAGFDVHATTNALILYRCIQSEERLYDVILVDGGRQDLPAHEFARRMRTRHPDVAVVVAAHSFHVLRAPYDAWIEKPYRPGALAEIVNTAEFARERRRGRSTVS